MVFSCFAVYVLANNTRVVLYYFEQCMAPLDTKRQWLDCSQLIQQIDSVKLYNGKCEGQIYWTLKVNFGFVTGVSMHVLRYFINICLFRKQTFLLQSNFCIPQCIFNGDLNIRLCSVLFTMHCGTLSHVQFKFKLDYDKAPQPTVINKDYI